MLTSCNTYRKTFGHIKRGQLDKTPEGISRYENLQELLNGIKDFVDQENDKPEEQRNTSLSYYIEEIALLTDADSNLDDNAIMFH